MTLLSHCARRRQRCKSAPSLLDAAVAQALTQFESGGEALSRELVFAEPLVSDAAEVETIGFAPGVLAVRRFRAVERIAGVLKGFVGVAGGEVRFGEGEPEVN